MGENSKDVLMRVEATHRAGVDEIREMLLWTGEAARGLYEAADRVRQAHMGDEVFLRGIIEFSNYCTRSCDYCGIRGPNRDVQRYRMSPAEVVAVALEAKHLGNTTVVLQSGEDPWFTCETICGMLRAIKEQAGVAITLSIGERPLKELIRFREAGCDRYLLRFETSDRALFARVHPDDDFDGRVQCLRDIRQAGIQLGSGFMIGLAGGTVDTIANDILFATALDLDMIGCGPFLTSPGTPLADAVETGVGRMFKDTTIYFNAIAILRLLNPKAHIPATTAFDALQGDGRDLVLQRGANVFMPNVTPQRYRVHYQLYANKPCVDEDSGQCSQCVRGRVARIGRTVGSGPGDSRRG
jgi:biotin synthase